MDWVHEGVMFRTFRWPPKVTDEEQYKKDIQVFSGGLEEVVTEKLHSLVTRYDELISARKADLARIHQRVRQGKIDEFSEYFWTFLAETRFDEISYVKAWMKHWIKIEENITQQALLKQFTQDGQLTSVQIDHAKEKPIEELYEGDLRPSGNRLFGRCPFHDEHTASFVIYQSDNSYFCYGCQEHGDAIAFVMKTKKISFIDAVKELQ